MITRPLGGLRLSILGLDASTPPSETDIARARAAGITWLWLPAGASPADLPTGFRVVAELAPDQDRLPAIPELAVLVISGAARALPEIVAARQSGQLQGLLVRAQNREELAPWLARMPQLDGLVCTFNALEDHFQHSELCEDCAKRNLSVIALDALDGGRLSRDATPCPPPPGDSAPNSERRDWAAARIAAYAAENELHPSELATGLIAATPAIAGMALKPSDIPETVNLGDLGMPARTRPLTRALKVAAWYHRRAGDAQRED